MPLGPPGQVSTHPVSALRPVVGCDSPRSGPSGSITMKVSADLCIVPMGVGPSVSPYVREIKAIIEASGLTATMHPNGTNIEAELSEVCTLAERCEARLAELGVERTFFTLIFSTRRDKEQSMADKLAAVS